MSSRIPLALFLIIADAAFALSYHSAVAWALILLPIASLVRRPLFAIQRFATVMTRTSWLLVAAVAARADLFGWPAGMALGALAGIFLLNERAFPVARAFLPAALGVLLAAASNSKAPYLIPLAWLATAALALWLVVSRRRSPLALALFAIPAFVLAQSLILLLPWAQPKVEQAAAEFMDPNVAGTGLSIGARLGEIENLALSRNIVLRMWSAAPAYLRAGVYTQFDGRTWTLPRRSVGSRLLLPEGQPPAAPPSIDDLPGSWHAVRGAPVSSAPVFARFVIEEHAPRVLPAPSRVEAVRTNQAPMALDRFDLLQAPPRRPETYAIRYLPGPVPERAGDEDITADCLQVPPQTDPRVRDLAKQLGSDAATAHEKIARTVAHVQSQCRYSLNVGAFRTTDPVAEFLFDKRKGYCEYFATATVVLLRLQGVPARYVNGLSVRAADRRGDHYVVRASGAHAWAEALVPGVGWIEVDATPPGDFAAVHAGQDSWLADALERIRSRWSDALARVRQGGWAAFRQMLLRGVRRVVPWVLGVGAVIVAVRRLRRWRRRPRPRPEPVSSGVSPELAACLQRLDAVWTKKGCPRPGHRALIEHAGALPPARVSPELRALGLEVAGQFYRGAYGGQDIAPEEIARLNQALDRC